MKINLTGQSIPSRSVIGSPQRYLNVYSESTDQNQDEPGQITHYPTPGLRLLATSPDGVLRGLYRASNGDLYAAGQTKLFYVDSAWVFHQIGSIGQVGTPVRMIDNGVNLIAVDGSPNGYSITLADHGASGITELAGVPDPDGSGAGWLGSDWIDYADTYFICNSPGTPIFYISDSVATTFSPLQFASKSGFSDKLVAAVAMHRVIWLIGELTCEIWYNSGPDGSIPGNTFPYQLMPAVLIDVGCAAKYSIAKADLNIFFVAQTAHGEAVVLKGSGYSTERISNHGIEDVMRQMPTVSDAVGYCYMQDGHTFYVLSFPSGDKTFVYDLAMNQWHERCYLDADGVEHRHRSQFHAFAYNTNVVSDHSSAAVYALDLATYTDNGLPIKREIIFPRTIDAQNDHRVCFRYFIAEMACGEAIDPAADDNVALKWSDDKGRTWSNGIAMPIGKQGAYNTLMKWNRLGLSRNRVFAMEWVSSGPWALQGAFVDVEKAGS